MACIICATSHSLPAITERGYTGHHCPSCNLIYISPRPLRTAIMNLYSHDEAQISASTHVRGELLARLRARHTLALMRRYQKSGTLLEIGAGGGYFLDEARRAGLSPYAIELNPVQAAFIEATLKIPCEQQPLSPHSFGLERFNVIYHSDVISHFYDPLEDLAIMREKLLPEGYMMFETGNIGDIDPKYYNLFASFQYPDHLFFFSERSLQLLLAKTGFKLIALHRYTISPQLKLMQLVQRVRTPRTPGASASTQAAPTASYAQAIYHRLLHTTRYTLGAFMPKGKRPQTFIVIAQRL